MTMNEPEYVNFRQRSKGSGSSLERSPIAPHEVGKLEEINAVQNTKEPDIPDPEELEDYFPRFLMFLIGSFRLADPKARNQWIFKAALFLGNRIYWPFHLLKMIFDEKVRFLDLNVGEEIFWTICSCVAVDIYQSLRKYLSQHAVHLLGEHINIRLLQRRTNAVVFIGGFFSFCLVIIFIIAYVEYYWHIYELFDQVVFPLRIVPWFITWLFIYALLPGSIYILCELLGGDLARVISKLSEDLSEDAHPSLKAFLWSVKEVDEKMLKFNDTFQCSLSMMFFLIWPLLIVALWYHPFWHTLSFVCSLEIVVILLLYVLTLPSIPGAKLFRSINKINPAPSEFDHFLFAMKRRGLMVGGVAFCGLKINNQVFWFFISCFVLLPTLIKIAEY